jgi:hypothetical protein
MFGYAQGTFSVDKETGQVSLCDDYSHASCRIRIEIEDDDDKFDGDSDGGKGEKSTSDVGNDEKGTDDSQSAQIYNAKGDEVEGGQIYVEEYYYLSGDDGSNIMVDVLEIDGEVVGYLPSAPLDSEVTYTQTDAYDVDQYSTLQYGDYKDVPCFVAGMRVATARGQVPVEWLCAGEEILTRDHGYQSILWTGITHLSADDLRHQPSLNPIELDAVEEFAPLAVSPQHRMLVEGPQIGLYFDQSEMLCAAQFLAQRPDMRRITPQGGLAYCHILLPEHEVILVEGRWSESLFAGDQTLRNFPKIRRAVQAHERSGKLLHRQTARRCLRAHEAMLLDTDQPLVSPPVGRFLAA